MILDGVVTENYAHFHYQIVDCVFGVGRVGPAGAIDPARESGAQFRLVRQYSEVMFFVVLALYPVVSQTIFQTFLCQELEGAECTAPPTYAGDASECGFPALSERQDQFKPTWYSMDTAWQEEECPPGCEFSESVYMLTADFQVHCYEEGHTATLVLAILLVLVFVLGAPLSVVFLLFLNRDQLRIEGTKQRDIFAPVVGTYRPECWYWEAIEMFRRVALTGLVIFFERGSMYQLAMGLQLSAFFLGAALHFRPFQSRFNNNFKLVTDLAVMCTFAFAIITSDRVDKAKEPFFVTDEAIMETLFMIVNVGMPVAVVATEIARTMNDDGVSGLFRNLCGGGTPAKEEESVRFVNPLE